MNSDTYDYDYLDGNAAAGELSAIFAMDVTIAEAQCAHCGAIKRFAEAHLYMEAPGVVARCAVCEHVILRFVKARQRAFLDLRGMTCLILDTSQLQECGLRRAAERNRAPSGGRQAQGKAGPRISHRGDPQSASRHGGQ
jgi:hypothetical protein